MARASRPAVRHLRARAVLRDPLRILRLQHLHAGRAGRRPNPDGWLAARCGPSCALAAAQLRAAPHGADRLRRRRHAVAAGRRRGSPRCSTRSATTSRSPPTPRSPPRPTRSRRRRSSSPDCAPPGSRGCRWACSRRHRTCCGARPGALAGPGARRGAGGAGPGFRPRQHRPHLRHAGGDRRRPAPLRRTRPSTPASTTSRPTRWSSRTAPRWRGGCAAVRCPRPTTTCWPDATSCSTVGSPTPASTGTRCRTGPPRRASAGTTSATGTAAMVGRRPRRARLRRLHPVVECQAPQRLCRSA